MAATLDSALEHAKRWLSGLDERSVAPTADLELLRSRIARPLPETPTEPLAVVDEIAAMVDGGLMGSTSGRFYAWVIGGAVESALAADWLATIWDQNAALYVTSPAAAVVEETVGAWLKELLGLPREASFALTTGCQLAHVTALAAARHRVLERVGWDLGDSGLFGAPPIRVLVNRERHGSVERGLRLLGFGRRSLEPVDTDDLGRIRPSSLEDALARSPGPKILVLNAADLNIGACDRFAEVIPMAKDTGAWVHVDGAFGLFARASGARAHLLEGVEAADSWATDAHKWLNVPQDCGLAFVHDPRAHHAAMATSADYFELHRAARDQMDWNPEWSRRARGFAVYAALRQLGRSGVEALVDRCCDHCHALVTGIGSLPGARVVHEPELNQGLVCFEHPEADADPAAQDAFNDEVIERINATGEVFFSGTTWRGRRAMRVSVVNWRTSEADVERVLAAVAGVLERPTRSAR